MPPPIITAITAQDEALKKCQKGSRSSARARIRPVCFATSREKTRGGNLVLIRPVDRGVFDGSFTRDGVTLVSRPQLYGDLKRRGGTAAEGAAFLRERGELWPR
jgi:hypothetical protein